MGMDRRRMHMGGCAPSPRLPRSSGLQEDARSSRVRFCTKGLEARRLCVRRRRRNCRRRLVYGVSSGRHGASAFRRPRRVLRRMRRYVPLLCVHGRVGRRSLCIALPSQAAGRIAEAFGDRPPVLRTAVCGLVLGAVAVFLPYVLFPGTQQFASIGESWQKHDGTGVARNRGGQDVPRGVLPENGLVAEAHICRWCFAPSFSVTAWRRCSAQMPWYAYAPRSARSWARLLGNSSAPSFSCCCLFAPQSIPLVAVCTAAGMRFPCREMLRKPNDAA